MVKKTLGRGITTMKDASKSVITFKYEELPDFFYKCGMRTHGDYKKLLWPLNAGKNWVS